MRLILLPGMDGTGRLFAPLLRALESSLTPVVVAYPTDQALGYAELLPLVESAAVGSDFLVLGESFSGPLALLLAARRPPGLRGVILTASFVRSPLPAFARPLRGLAIPLWVRATPPALLRWALLGRFHTKALGESVEAAVAAVRPVVLAARARAILSLDVTRELRSCCVPVLYLSATEDRLIGPGNLSFIREQFPAVEAVALRGPHLILQAAPAAAAEVIRTFAASCERSARPQP